MHLSRRGVLRGGAAAAGLAAAGGLATGRAAPAYAGAGSTRPVSAFVSDDAALHAARRLSYGPTPELVAEIRSAGLAAWVDRQLDPETIDDAGCDALLARLPLLGLEPAAVRSRIAVGSWDQMEQLMQAAVARAVWSKRQLFELMTEFWWNHFNVSIPNADVWDLMGAHDSVIRSHTLGRFADLLAAVEQSPAMLRFLNQDTSSGTAPNENLAREMLELHTVGVHGGYGERDVKSAALLLTGLAIGDDGESTYHQSWHAVGPVEVMDFRAANASADGRPVLADYLDYLAHHPSTAHHLATKLVTRFVSDHPSAALVERLAGVYLANDTAIAPVLRELFAGDEFASSVAAKTRRPLEDVAATMRILGYEWSPGTSDLEDVTFALAVMGQSPMGWPDPDGYPDVAAAWNAPGTCQALWGVHLRLTGGWWSRDLRFGGMAPLLRNPSGSISAGDLVDRLADRLLMQRLAPEHRATLVAFLGVGENDPVGDGQATTGLAMLAKLLLDSPYWTAR